MRATDLADVVAGVIRTVVTPLQARIAALEAREPVPGPAGPQGPPGASGLRYHGVHVTGRAYDPGDVVTFDGSAWYCATATTGRPKEVGDAWQLMVKRGSDARKDGRP